jgi:hypothetical protein
MLIAALHCLTHNVVPVQHHVCHAPVDAQEYTRFEGYKVLDGFFFFWIAAGVNRSSTCSLSASNAGPSLRQGGQVVLKHTWAGI